MYKQSNVNGGWCQRNLGRARGLSSRALTGSMALLMARFPYHGLQNCERINDCHFQPQFVAFCYHGPRKLRQGHQDYKMLALYS